MTSTTLERGGPQEQPPPEQPIIDPLTNPITDPLTDPLTDPINPMPPMDDIQPSPDPSQPTGPIDPDSDVVIDPMENPDGVTENPELEPVVPR